MRIHEVRLENFKRFTDLTIKDIPDTAQLVLLIGSNGAGKSCVFDAFNWVVAPAQGFQPTHLEDSEPYFQKVADAPPSVVIGTNKTSIKRTEGEFSQQDSGRFYGRSSLRIPPRVEKPSHESSLTEVMANNADTPEYFIDNDYRFFTDVHVHADILNQSLQRLLVEGKANEEETRKVRDKYISKINNALINIFGDDPKKTLRFAVYKQPSPSKPVEPYFKKGDSEIQFFS